MRPRYILPARIKTTEAQVKETLNGFDDYYSFYSSSTVTTGFSGVAVYSKIKPNKVSCGVGSTRKKAEFTSRIR